MMGSVLLVLLVAFMAYVRLAPLDESRWHQPIDAASDVDFAGGAIRVLKGDAALFERLDRALSGLPRTQLLAGSPGQGRVTYVTRSALFGFPDLTTLESGAGEVRLYARLRFGASDLGVNRKRLEGLIASVQGG